MFGAIKRLFRKDEAGPPTTTAAPIPPPPSPASPPPAPATAAKPPATPRPAPASSTDEVTVSFLSILAQVPPELHGRLAPAGAGDARFSLPRAQVLQQLPQGAVKVTFGELRRAAPAGLFAPGGDHDSRPIALPLQEILTQVPPSAWARRPNQRRVTVGDDLPDLFGPKGEPNARLRVLSKEELRASAATPPVRPPPRPSTGTEVRRMAAAARKTQPTGTQHLAKATTAASAPPNPTPEAKPVEPPKISATGLAAALGAPPPSKPAPPTTPAPPAKAPPAGASAVLRVPLAELALEWPEPVRQDIQRLDCLAAQCAVPLAHIEGGLKSGKVEVLWSNVVDWLTPRPAQTASANAADTWVELPLKLLVPLYLEHHKPARKAKVVSVSDSVPDLFTKDGPKSVTPTPKSERGRSPAGPGSSATAAPPEARARAGTARFMALSLGVLADQWPEPIRREVDQHNLRATRLELPLDVVEAGLRAGKVEFPWKQLCAWIKDCPQSVPSPVTAETLVTLPLPVVAPLFLKLRPPRKAANSGQEASHIPDLFSPSGELRPEAVAESSTRPADSAAPAAPAPVEPPPPAAAPAAASAPAPATKPPADIAELFGEPQKRNWTPNEIVHKVCCLPGVAGAMIALQDGLMVAHCMPPNWKTETIAAFLPQIYGRVNQYARELKMGELRSFSFAVEQGTLQIFAAGIIYFGVLGKAGQPLPQFELNLIATELSRHTK